MCFCQEESVVWSNADVLEIYSKLWAEEISNGSPLMKHCEAEGFYTVIRTLRTDVRAAVPCTNAIQCAISVLLVYKLSISA